MTTGQIRGFSTRQWVARATKRAHHPPTEDQGGQATGQDHGGEDPGDGVVEGNDSRRRIGDHAHPVLAGGVRQGLGGAGHQRNPHRRQACAPGNSDSGALQQQDSGFHKQQGQALATNATPTDARLVRQRTVTQAQRSSRSLVSTSGRDRCGIRVQILGFRV